jgi:hypothetical protein
LWGLLWACMTKLNDCVLADDLRMWLGVSSLCYGDCLSVLLGVVASDLPSCASNSGSVCHLHFEIYNPIVIGRRWRIPLFSCPITSLYATSNLLNLRYEWMNNQSSINHQLSTQSLIWNDVIVMKKYQPRKAWNFSNCSAICVYGNGPHLTWWVGLLWPYLWSW